MVLQCQLEANKSKCTCTYEPCERKGKCCDCIFYHRSMDELPGCLFPPEVECTYDRSRARYIRAFAGKRQ